MSSTAETGTSREVIPNFNSFVGEAKFLVTQRVSTQSKSAEIMGRKDSVNSSGVQIVIVDMADVIGTKHLVQSEVGVFVSQTSGGNQRHVTQEVTEGGGAGLVTDLGMLKPPASHVIPAQTGMTGRLASTRGNGRRNRFASIVTGTQEQKKVGLLGTRNTTLYHNMRTLPRTKKPRSHRSKSYGHLSPARYLILKAFCRKRFLRDKHNT